MRFTVRETRVLNPGSRRWRFGDLGLHRFWLIHPCDRRTELRWLGRAESSMKNYEAIECVCVCHVQCCRKASWEMASRELNERWFLVGCADLTASLSAHFLHENVRILNGERQPERLRTRRRGKKCRAKWKSNPAWFYALILSQFCLFARCFLTDYW